MPTVTPFLWFDADLAEALELYADLFGDIDVQILQGEAGPGFFVASFTVFGQTVTAMNAGPGHAHTDAFSLYLSVNGQEEVDRYWDGLLAGGGTPVQCGWLKDRFGISWQVVPAELEAALGNPDPEKATYARDAMMKQQKIVISELTA